MNKQTADLNVDKVNFARNNMIGTGTNVDFKAIDTLVDAYAKDGNSIFGNIE
ncbi:MAG: hypothetical protein IKT40_04805 [Bacilli bacterium]|nr:hypothetical protein [Bacilli bacterium]